MYVYIRICTFGYLTLYLARYDYPCIFPAMIKVLQQTHEADHPETELKINMIKQGAQYRSIYTERFTFGDCLNYSSPCKYSNYLKQWKVHEEKSIFPYQYYSSVEELEAATDFPPKQAFYSDLTEVGVTDEEYESAKNEYDSRRALPGKYIYTGIYPYIYTYMYQYIYEYIYVYVPVYVRIYTSTYTYLYII